MKQSMIIQTGSDIGPGNNSDTFYTCKLLFKRYFMHELYY